MAASSIFHFLISLFSVQEEILNFHAEIKKLKNESSSFSSENDQRRTNLKTR